MLLLKLNIYIIMDFCLIIILFFKNVLFFKKILRNGKIEGVNIIGVVCINKLFNVLVGLLVCVEFCVYF